MQTGNKYYFVDGLTAHGCTARKHYCRHEIVPCRPILLATASPGGLGAKTLLTAGVSDVTGAQSCRRRWLPRFELFAYHQQAVLLQAVMTNHGIITGNHMSATPADLFALFDRLGIQHTTIEHPPFFTVEEGQPWHDKIPGLHCKNLFIKDRKGGIWLVIMPASKRADLGRLEKLLGAPRFSFARPDVLQEVLALTPGSVTPFALINDTQRCVTVVLDEAILDDEWVNLHPLHNAASTTLRSADLLRFVRALGYEPVVVRLLDAAANG